MARRLFSLVLAGAFCAALLLAADITGTWAGTMVAGDNQIPLTYNFKQDGAKLTGTVTGPNGDLPLADGKVDGDKISFSVMVDMGGNPTKFVGEGTVKSADEIVLKTTAPDFEAPPMTLKRSK
jgi:hypothetical protein